MQQKRKPAPLKTKQKEELNKKLLIGLAAGFAVVVIAMAVLLIVQQ
ncbi:hypothetical protein [Paenibacillus hamazuiensis]|nr:hypothetical protein [Paenibacillus hamazuiensis]